MKLYSFVVKASDRQRLKYRNDETYAMSKAAPLIGILAIGGLGLYYLQNQASATNTNTNPDGSTTTTTTNSDGTTTTTTLNTDGTTTTANYDSSGNLMETDTTPTTTQEQEEADKNLRADKEWLPADLGRDYFREFIEGSVDEEQNPFLQRKLYGKTIWRNSKKVELYDYDWSSKKSGGIKLEPKGNYRVKIEVRTNNANYFANGVYVDGNKNKDSLKTWVNENTDGSAGDETFTVWMTGGDWLSVDIDQEHSGVREFRLGLNGTKLTDDGEDPDDEVFVKLKAVEIKNPNYDAERFGSETFNAPGGLIGLGAKLLSGTKTLLTGGLRAIGIGKNVSTGAAATAGVTNTVAKTIRNNGLDIATLKRVPTTNPTKASLESLDGVVSATNDAKRIKVATNYQAISVANGKIIPKATGGFVDVQKGMALVKKVETTTPVAGAGFLSGMKFPRPGFNALVGTTQIAVGLFVINTAYQLSMILPSAVGDAVKNTYTTALGLNCEEDCANSPDFDTCVEECKERSNQLLATIGTFGLLGVLGIVLILKSGKSEASSAAEGYYLVG